MSNDNSPQVQPAPVGVPMETPGATIIVPTAPDQLEGADRSGLGDKGWAETPDDLTGHPDETNIGPEMHRDPPNAPQDKERGA
jgi:hypothetical protein